MIQDIYPHVYHNEYKNITPEDDDYVICFHRDKVLLKKDDELNVTIPRKKDNSFSDLIYLFSIDDERYFLSLGEVDEINGFRFEFNQIIRFVKPEYISFVLVTAMSLNDWYRKHRYCGRCGHKMIRDEKERMVRCPECRNMIYPTISPAVIVAVIDGDKILMSRYSTGHKNYALIAGFTEIGETIEETVKREVHEEVGIQVKNLKYYKSQPWPFSNSVLMGFFCELDGDNTLKVDENELSFAGWFTPEEMSERKDHVSLTSEMMELFRTGKYKELY